MLPCSIGSLLAGYCLSNLKSITPRLGYASLVANARSNPARNPRRLQAALPYVPLGLFQVMNERSALFTMHNGF